MSGYLSFFPNKYQAKWTNKQAYMHFPTEQRVIIKTNQAQINFLFVQFKTYNDSTFNPQILLLEKPKLNASFLHPRDRKEKNRFKTQQPINKQQKLTRPGREPVTEANSDLHFEET